MGNDVHVLIVDDNKDFCQNIQDVLELKGYSTEYATDGFAALDIVGKKKIDLGLLDIKMPGMNGVETFKEIKKISPQSDVIMVTAFAVEEMIMKSLENGAFGMLRKPIDFDKLFSLIEKITFKGSLILVADDDQDFCNNMEDLLSGRGYLVNHALDGESAIRQAEESNFDVMLLDLKLPALDGFEIYSRIKRFRPQLVVIIITGFLDELNDQIENILKHNVYACLEKPIDINQLLQILDKVKKRQK